MSANLKFLKLITAEMGVKESVGSKDNPKVVEYHRCANKSNTNRQPDSVAWCSSFACYIVEKAGYMSTNSMMARSWENWGKKIKLSDAMPGDIFVFYRNGINSGSGHVTFLVAKVGNLYYCAGGNQNDSVCISAYSTERLLSVRRVSDAAHNQPAIEELKSYAKNMLAGKAVGSGAKES